MADTTKIAWVRNSDGTPGATFNPWIGCTRVSAGCVNCYAEVLGTNRLGVEWGKGKPRRRTAATTWKMPQRWNRKAAKLGIRIRVFCASLADVFDPEVPAEWRAELWQLIRETPNLDWIIVTKRPENFVAMLPEDWGGGWENVWLVVTCEDQAAADRRIPILLNTHAAVRGVSLEPLLGPINLNRIHEEWTDEFGCHTQCWESCLTGRRFDGWSDGETDGWTKLDWVIVGGESGTEARTCRAEWFDRIWRDCRAAGVPLFVKQLGTRWIDGANGVGGARSHIPSEYPNVRRLAHPTGADPEEWPEYLRVQQMPGVPR